MASTHEIQKPEKGERIVVKRLSDGCVEVLYEEAKSATPKPAK